MTQNIAICSRRVCSSKTAVWLMLIKICINDRYEQYSDINALFSSKKERKEISQTLH